MTNEVTDTLPEPAPDDKVDSAWNRFNTAVRNAELLAALILLRTRHAIEGSHNEQPCPYCKQADAAIARAQS